MGVWVYSFDSRTYRRLGDGTESAWLADGRRLLASFTGGLRVIDSISGDVKEILRIPGETLGYPLAVAGLARVRPRPICRADIEPPVTFDDMDAASRLVDALLEPANRI